MRYPIKWLKREGVEYGKYVEWESMDIEIYASSNCTDDIMQNPAVSTLGISWKRRSFWQRLWERTLGTAGVQKKRTHSCRDN